MGQIKLIIILFVISGCASNYLKVKDEKKLELNNEFEKEVQIVEIEPPPPEEKKIDSEKTVEGSGPAFPLPQPPPLDTTPKNIDTKKTKAQITAPPPAKKKVEAKKEISRSAGVPKKREPPIESQLGFENGSRRPIIDPFRVGEKVVHSVKYFKATAGELTFEVLPFVLVNGKKSYRFQLTLETKGLFSRFYSVEDKVDTLVDFETLVPSVFSLHVKESAQLKEARAHFDPLTLQATYWEKKYTEKNGHQEKKQQWTMNAYSQNVYSAPFYMRVFNYEIGKETAFYVADDEKNVTFKGKAIRKERIETEAGTFNTIVIKPELEIGGVFKPVGDIYFWLTDDDRRFIVRIESDIKIGTLISEVIRIESHGN